LPAPIVNGGVRVACCPLTNHVNYAQRALISFEKERDRQTDGRTSDRYIMLSSRRGSVIT